MENNKVMLRTKECVDSIKNSDVYSDILSDVINFKELIDKQSYTASKETHYHNLDNWNDVIYGYVRIMLEKYGFKNGQSKQNPNATIWWIVYSIISSITYSPNLISNVAPHHSSAFSRNEALKKEIEYIINQIKN